MGVAEISATEGRRLHSGFTEVFIRGGNWNNGSNDGPFTLNLNWSTTNANNNVGFRCARYSSIKSIHFYILWPERNIYGFLLRLRAECGPWTFSTLLLVQGPGLCQDGYCLLSFSGRARA